MPGRCRRPVNVKQSAMPCTCTTQSSLGQTQVDWWPDQGSMILIHVLAAVLFAHSKLSSSHVHGLQKPVFLIERLAQ